MILFLRTYAFFLVILAFLCGYVVYFNNGWIKSPIVRRMLGLSADPRTYLTQKMKPMLAAQHEVFCWLLIAFGLAAACKMIVDLVL